MAKNDNVKYWWIKLETNFFYQNAIDFLMSQTNGSDYVVLYQMLCLKTANSQGRLETQVGDMIIKYDIPKIQRDTKYFSEDTIRVALDLYKGLGLVYEEKDGTMLINHHDAMVGYQTGAAKRVAEARKNKGNKLGTNVPKSIEFRDKSLDVKNKEKKEIKRAYGEFKNVKLTEEEENKLKERFPNAYKDYIERLSAYIAQSGKRYKSHYATILNWSRKDNQEQHKPKNEIKGITVV